MAFCQRLAVSTMLQTLGHRAKTSALPEILTSPSLPFRCEKASPLCIYKCFKLFTLHRGTGLRRPFSPALTPADGLGDGLREGRLDVPLTDGSSRPEGLVPSESSFLPFVGLTLQGPCWGQSPFCSRCLKTSTDGGLRGSQGKPWHTEPWPRLGPPLGRANST